MTTKDNTAERGGEVPAHVYDLDPDFRRDRPKGRELECCAKCQRVVDVHKTRKAWVNWGTWKVSLSREAIAGDSHGHEIAEEYIGNDCWKTIGLPN